MSEAQKASSWNGCGHRQAGHVSACCIAETRTQPPRVPSAQRRSWCALCRVCPAALAFLAAGAIISGKVASSEGSRADVTIALLRRAPSVAAFGPRGGSELGSDHCFWPRRLRVGGASRKGVGAGRPGLCGKVAACKTQHISSSGVCPAAVASAPSSCSPPSATQRRISSAAAVHSGGGTWRLAKCAQHAAINTPPNAVPTHNHPQQWEQGPQPGG